MQIIKRNGSTTEFDKSKIEKAILRAMKYGSGIIKKDVAQDIAQDTYEVFKDDNVPPTVYQVEDTVYHSLISYGEDLTAKAYEGYRAVQAFKRESNTTDDSILSLINRMNEDVMDENSNKNAAIVPTQRDLIAGEISKDIARRKLIPAHIVQAHDEGVLHYHDMDYAMQSMMNCFSGDTKFITNLGVLSFNDCNHNQEVEVLDKDGNWRKATVKKYNKQQLQTITLSSGRTIKKIRATRNHRWLLKNGDITTDLQVGNKLHLLKETAIDEMNNDMLCFGFVLGDGSDCKYSTVNRIKVRLCKSKTSLLSNFIQAGYVVSSYKEEGSDDIFLAKTTEWSKNSFLENKCWRYLSKEDKVSLFTGYYLADGFKDRNGIATANENLALMIREISALAGYHITSEKFEVRNTNFKEDAQLYTFRFMKRQPSNRNWIVKDINRQDKHLYDVWCVEEPVTHTFTLNNGVVTGNCCLVNIKDMLENGTVINGKLVESPQSFQTACTILTQIIAQVASAQYGGQSVNVKHLGEYLFRSEAKYCNMLKDVISDDNEFEKAVEKLLLKELAAGVQTIQYQINTLMTTNG